LRFLYPIFLLLLLSCAQQTSLTGGDKDTLAPILMVDSNRSLVNIKQASINLKFNENIQFLKGKRALITNPPISEVVITEEKNKIEINWEDTLNPNTTYSFLFLNSIADITEKNKIKEFNYVVSTGPKIDSGSLMGTIIKYPEKEVFKDGLIRIVNSKDKKYTYRTYTDKNGKYQLNYIKKGEYQLYCFQDENNNLQLDTLMEDHGFYKEAILVSDSSTIANTIAYSPKRKTSLDNYSFNHFGRLELEFNTPVDSCMVTDLTTNTIYQSNYMSSKHLFYFSDTLAKHSLIIKSGNDFKDTIRVSFEDKTELENKISYKEEKTNTLISKEGFTLEFNQFIKEIDTSLIEIAADSILINASFKINKNFLTIFPKSKENNYKMTLLPNSITGIKEAKKDTSIVNFMISNNINLSTLELTLFNIPYPKSIIQIIQNKQVVKELRLSADKLEYSISRCKPGDYEIKLIGDLNGDGYWTIGNIEKNVLPEPIVDYNGVLQLKKNWTSNIQWDFKSEN
jgi:uncharacterized protein (DUF2141 family)